MLSSSLPSELVTEILAQLPVKSLVRFRCVSKPYETLIGSSTFISKHLKRINQLGRKECILLGVRFDDSNVIIPTITCRVDSSDYQISELCLHRVNNYELLKLVGSCNGLVCLRKDRNGSVNFLWNPATRDFRPLPVFPDVDKFDTARLVFGFDSDNKDYKLLILTSAGVAHLYTTSTNSWRSIRTEIQIGYLHDDHSPLVNGCFHWYDSTNRFIVSFDIGKEVFQKLPAVDLSKHGRAWVLDSMNGSLVMITYDQGSGPVRNHTIWVMHDYGVDGYWTKHFSFEFSNSDPGPPHPIGFLINGELLMQEFITGQFFSYNLDEDEMSPVSANLENWPGLYRYVESLARTHP